MAKIKINRKEYGVNGGSKSKRKVDIFDLLSPEAIKAVDKLGYKFLMQRGYDTKGAIKSSKKREELKKALKANGEELRYVGGINKEDKTILIFFEVVKAGKRVATSQGLKFIPKPIGGEQEEG